MSCVCAVRSAIRTARIDGLFESFHLWVFFPITTEFSAWYATVFVMDLIFLLALAGYGSYISLGGQSPFKIKLLAEG